MRIAPSCNICTPVGLIRSLQFELEIDTNSRNLTRRSFDICPVSAVDYVLQSPLPPAGFADLAYVDTVHAYARMFGVHSLLWPSATLLREWACNGAIDSAIKLGSYVRSTHVESFVYKSRTRRQGGSELNRQYKRPCWCRLDQQSQKKYFLLK